MDSSCLWKRTYTPCIVKPARYHYATPVLNTIQVMQSPHFHTRAYGHSVEPTSALNTSESKIHHPVSATDSEAGSFYNYNYDIQGMYTADDCSGFIQTPYTESSTIFPPGYIHQNTRNSSCSKTSTRRMDLADFTRTRQEDICVPTPRQSFSLSSSPTFYNTNMLDDQSNHHHNQYQHQIHSNYKNQFSEDLTPRAKPNAKYTQEPASILSKTSPKMEPPNQQLHPNPKISISSNSPTASESHTNVRNTRENTAATNHKCTLSSCAQEILRNSPNQRDSNLDKISTRNSPHVSSKNPGSSEKNQDTIPCDSKPTLSYIALIAKAILESEQRRLSLGSIYTWIEKNYPFYRNKGHGWRNSVRHNLSLNYCFIKSGRCEDGKGNYWAIHPANIQDFMSGDFRQRRRSRRRGKKGDCNLDILHAPSEYLQSPSMQLTSGMTLYPPDLCPPLSPYTKAERRAYRLDEAIFRQRVGIPFVKWCQEGVATTGSGRPTSLPACGTGTCSTSSDLLSQPYNEGDSYSVYPDLSSTLQR